MPSDTHQKNLRAELIEQDRRIFDLQALLKAGQALHSALDINQLCKLLMAMVCERAQAREIAILLMASPDQDGDERCLEVVATQGLPSEINGLRFPLEDGIFWRLITAGEPFSVCDRGDQPHFTHLFATRNLRALHGKLWIPMVQAGEVIGVLSLGEREDHSTYPEEGFRFLWTLANQAAVAFSTARLYQSIQVARSDLDRSLHNLSMLFDVTRALGAISDLTRLLQLILNRAIAAVNSEKGSLMLLDDATGELVVRVVFGLPDQETQQRINDGELECKRFQRGEGVAGKVLATGQPILVNNIHDGQFTRAEGSHVQSIMCIPLKVDEDVIGVINITNRKDDRAFGTEDEHIMEALANQAAVAIARTRLYEAAITDGLTGLFVRRFVMHRFYEELRRTKRYHSPLSVIMCDIDHFKLVNDTHGHQAGDTVIIAVAQVLRDCLRQDVDVLGRYGGEEFLLLLPQTNLEGALRAAERLRKKLCESPIPINKETSLEITLSLGVTEVIPEFDEGEESVLKRADDALYRCKQEGRNRACAFEAGPPDKTPRLWRVQDLPPLPSPAKPSLEDAEDILVTTLGTASIVENQPDL